MDSKTTLLILSAIFSLIPIIIWLFLTFSDTKTPKKVISLVFFLGCFTAPLLLSIQFLPEAINASANFIKNKDMFMLADSITSIGNIILKTSPLSIIEKIFKTDFKILIATYILFAFLEEVIKLYVITLVDKKTVLIKTIGDSIKFAIAAALGFSFGENIYYLYKFWSQVEAKQLISMYIYRSIFTTCAHMIYSGIFGYYYGIGKFAIDITKQEKLAGEESFFNKILSKVFFTSKSKTYQNIMIAKGLAIAIVMHSTSNYLLGEQDVLPVVLFVILAYGYLQILLRRKAGNLILTTDLSTKKQSTIAKKDEEVVIELVGMWYQEKRYTDVIHICERLLERDPSNNVVQLFKAKALDEMKNEESAYKEILKTMFNKKNNKTNRSIISKHLEEKENLIKVRKKIKKQLEKEGKILRKLNKRKQNKSKITKDDMNTTFKMDL